MWHIRLTMDDDVAVRKVVDACSPEHYLVVKEWRSVDGVKENVHYHAWLQVKKPRSFMDYHVAKLGLEKTKKAIKQWTSHLEYFMKGVDGAEPEIVYTNIPKEKLDEARETWKKQKCKAFMDDKKERLSLYEEFMEFYKSYDKPQGLFQWVEGTPQSVVDQTNYQEKVIKAAAAFVKQRGKPPNFNQMDHIVKYMVYKECPDLYENRLRKNILGYDITYNGFSR